MDFIRVKQGKAEQNKVFLGNSKSISVAEIPRCRNLALPDFSSFCWRRQKAFENVKKEVDVLKVISEICTLAVIAIVIVVAIWVV